MAEKRGACPLKAGILTKGFTHCWKQKGKRLRRGIGMMGPEKLNFQGEGGAVLPLPLLCSPHPLLPTCLPYCAFPLPPQELSTGWQTNTPGQVVEADLGPHSGRSTF